MMTATMPRIVNDYPAAITALDVDAYVNCFAVDAIAHEPVGTAAYEGHAGIRQFFEATGGLFARINMRWTFVHQIGNEVAIKWQADGLGKNGRSVTFEGIDLWILNESGKIQSLQGYWDAQTLVAQLTQ